MQNRIFSKRTRWLFIVTPVLISLVMLLPLRKARINADLNTYLSDRIPAKQNIEKLEALFGKTDPIVLILKASDVLNDSTLTRIDELTCGFQKMESLKDVISLSTSKYIRGEEGSMLVDPVIRKLPETPEEKEILRSEIISNPLVYKLLISDDFQYTMILMNPAKGFSDDEIIKGIRHTLNEFPGPEKTWLNGMPYFRDEIQKKATRDLAILMPLGLLIMIGFLYFSFRELKGVFLPLSVVLMSIIVAMGLMPLLGYELSLIAVLVPILMIAIANNYGVHIITRYQEINARHPGRTMARIVSEAVYYLKKPILLTALTTIAGILGMVTHVMLPAKQMGIVSAAGITFALVLSLYYTPALLTGLKKGIPKKTYIQGKKTAIDNILMRMGKITTLWPQRVILVFLMSFILLGTGIYRLKVSINNEKMMPSSHPLRVSTALANEHFGGTKIISVLFEGDILDPDVLGSMDHFETELKKKPQVGGVTSLATVVRTISRALNDPGDSLYNAIPRNRETIAQYIELYNMSGDPADFEKLTDFGYTKANLNIQFKANNIQEFRDIEASIQKLADSSPYATLIAGNCLVEKELAEAIVRGQNYSLLFALFSIILLLAWIFRSFMAGIIGSIPLAFTLVCNFGLMGWAGFELDIATSLLSSVAIGLGVDYTIHFFWRLKTELSDGLEYKRAIRKTIKTTGRGIAINAFSVMIGFSVLFVSGLTILKSFGFLIIFSLTLCLLSALLFIPSICLLIRPRFLFQSPIGNFDKIINSKAA
jgi:uncharacterized protein